jgi:hypothetical protein
MTALLSSDGFWVISVYNSCIEIFCKIKTVRVCEGSKYVQWESEAKIYFLQVFFRKIISRQPLITSYIAKATVYLHGSLWFVFCSNAESFPMSTIFQNDYSAELYYWHDAIPLQLRPFTSLTDFWALSQNWEKWQLAPSFYIRVTVHHNKFILNNQPDALIIPILFCYKTLYVSGIFYAHHQEFSTVHSALPNFMQVSDDRILAELGWNAVPSWLCFIFAFLKHCRWMKPESWVVLNMIYHRQSSRVKAKVSQ